MGASEKAAAAFHPHGGPVGEVLREILVRAAHDAVHADCGCPFESVRGDAEAAVDAVLAALPDPVAYQALLTQLHEARAEVVRVGQEKAGAVQWGQSWCDRANVAETQVERLEEVLHQANNTTTRQINRACDAETREAALRAELAEGEASDGHHTHRELYEYRMLYNAHAAHGWLAAGIPVVKSRRHSDGEPCFGGGWFIVTATLPTGQVSNHYRDDRWDLFDVPAVDLPPEYDGHTPADAAARLRGLLDGEVRP